MALIRTLAPPYAGHRFRADDVIALWKTDEASAGAGILDFGGVWDLAHNGGSGSCGVAPSLFDRSGVTLGARTFDGSSSQIDLTTGVPVLDNWTWEAWVNWSGGAGTLVEAGRGGTTVANLVQLQVRILATGQVTVMWQTAVGVSVVSTTPTPVVIAGQTVHLACEKDDDPAGGGLKVARISINGFLVYTATGLADSAGGTSASWCLGASPLAGTFTTRADHFTGSMSNVRACKIAIGPEAIRDSYARGIRDWDEADLIKRRRYKVRQRVLVKDALGEWRDLSAQYGRDFVLGTTISDEKESDGVSASVSLKRSHFKFSLAPAMTASPINAIGGSYSKLIQERREIAIERALIPDGRELQPWMWQRRFNGFIDKVSSGQDPMTVECRGPQVPLTDTYMFTEEDYDLFAYFGATTLLEEQVQRLIDNWIPGGSRNPSPTAGYKGEPTATSTPQVWCPVSSAWALGFYRQKQDHVWSAAQTLVSQIAWDLRPQWDEIRQRYRLALTEPPRTKAVADLVIDPAQLLSFDAFDSSTEEVRNKVIVYYGDVLTPDNIGDPTRASVTVQDSVSIAKYGLLAAAIGEATTDNVNTAAEASRLATAFIRDCAEPKADAAATIRYATFPECDDMYTFPANGQQFDVATDLAVVGWSDTVEGGSATTELTLRGQPRGRVRSIMDGVIMPGGHVQRRKIPIAIPVVTRFADAVEGITVHVDIPHGPLAPGFDRVEFHVSPTSGFTPSASTLTDGVVSRSNQVLIGGLTPGTTYYVKAINRDVRGNASAPSAEATAVARFVARGLPRFRARASAVSTSVTTGKTTGKRVVFDVADFGAGFLSISGTTTIFTAPVDGDYRLEAGVCLGFAAGGDLSNAPEVGLYLNATADGTGNGTLLAASPSTIPADEVQTFTQCTVRLDAGDTVQVKCSTSYGASRSGSGTVQLGGAKTWFAGELIAD